MKQKKEFDAKVLQIGNSVGITIPKRIVGKMDIYVDDIVNIKVKK